MPTLLRLSLEDLVDTETNIAVKLDGEIITIEQTTALFSFLSEAVEIVAEEFGWGGDVVTNISVESGSIKAVIKFFKLKDSTREIIVAVIAGIIVEAVAGHGHQPPPSPPPIVQKVDQQTYANCVDRVGGSLGNFTSSMDTTGADWTATFTVTCPRSNHGAKPEVLKVSISNTGNGSDNGTSTFEE